MKAATLGAGLALALAIQTKADMLVRPPAASDCAKIMRLEHLASESSSLMRCLAPSRGWNCSAGSGAGSRLNRSR
jgi:hypothetical protein